MRGRCDWLGQVHNLHLIDERSAPLVGSLRVFGLGGSFSFSTFFNIGDGADAVGGLEATSKTWATAWQTGQLLELSGRFNPGTRRETVVFATSVASAAEPIVTMLAAAVKVGLLQTALLTRGDVAPSLTVPRALSHPRVCVGGVTPARLTSRSRHRRRPWRTSS